MIEDESGFNNDLSSKLYIEEELRFEDNSDFFNNSFNFSNIDDRDDSSSIFDLNLLNKDEFLFSDINNYNKNIKENWNFLDEEIFLFNQNSSLNEKSIREKVNNKNENENLQKSYIIEKNRNLSNSEKHDNKVNNQALSNYTPLENDHYFNNKNKESFDLNGTQIIDLDFQNSFKNYNYNNGTNLSNKSKIDDSLPFCQKTIDSFDLTFTNKKKKEVKVKFKILKIISKIYQSFYLIKILKGMQPYFLE